MQACPANHCFHCHQPLVDGDTYPATVLGVEHQMCCPGCQAVAEAIVENGLEDYYRFRTEPASKGDALLDETLNALNAYDQPEIQQDFVISDAGASTIQLTVEGISCAACGWLIEKRLSNLPGIRQIAVNVGARRATLSWYDDQIKLSQIMSLLERVGYHALPFQPDEHEASYQREQKSYLKKLGLAGLMTMQVMMLAFAMYFGVFGDLDNQTQQYFNWISLALTTPVALYSGSGFYRSAINAIRNRSLNMDVSVSLAILGTYVASARATVENTGDVYFESVCMFIFLLLISRFLELRSRHHAAQSSANMLKFIPVSATVVEGEETRLCLARQLTQGMTVLVKPGETIPVDGKIADGKTHIDESMLTGEFEPVKKGIGDPVFGGTQNHSGVIKVVVSKALKHSLVNQIMRMQEQAMAQKPKIAEFADRSSRYFVFAVLCIAALGYLGWQFIDPQRAFWIAIAILVATCPCALSLATPSAITSATGALNRKGMLLKRGDVLEVLPEIDTVLFDKTGTLTHGVFSVVRSEYPGTVNAQQVNSIAASLEFHSEHPIARSFRELAPYQKTTRIDVHPGSGISGNLQGNAYKIGSAEFVGFDAQNRFPWANVFVASDGELLGAFEITDTLREEARDVVKAFNHLAVGILSGDSPNRVAEIAGTLNVVEAKAAQTPEDKLNALKELQRQGHKVLMTGDGINDAPVLGSADVSIAVGNASDLAKQSADVILLNQSIEHLPYLFELAKRARQVIKQNMVWALGYNLLILPLAITGYLSPWMAVLGMSASSILVVLNSLRLTR